MTWYIVSCPCFSEGRISKNSNYSSLQRGVVLLPKESRLLGVIWAAVLVGIVGVYVSRIPRYPHNNSFVTAIAYPTLGLTVLYLIMEIVKLRLQRAETERDAVISQYSSNIENSSAIFSREEHIKKVNIHGFGMALGVAVVYILLIPVLGFMLDSIILIVTTPILLGERLRRIPVLLLVGFCLVIVLHEIVRVSGIGVLPSRIFHVSVSF